MKKMAVGILVAFLVAGAIWALASRDDASGGPLNAIDNPPPFQHIHGLGIDPADHALYAATHGGLYRIEDGQASIIANRYQDTMGFLVAGKNHFIGSGHPDLREELPPLLGFIESTDAGKKWKKKSLLGEADFHALRRAHGQIWGYDSTSSRLLVSSDGIKWEERSTAVMRDFVVSPKSPDVLLKTTGEALQRSEDGGESWESIEAPTGPLLLAWEKGETVWLFTTDGDVFRSKDAGRSFDKRGSLSGTPEAFVATEEGLFAAAHSDIFRSTDDGKTWETFFSEDDSGAEGAR